MIASELPPDQERPAQILAELHQSHVHDALVDVARILVASPDSQLLGGRGGDGCPNGGDGQEVSFHQGR